METNLNVYVKASNGRLLCNMLCDFEAQFTTPHRAGIISDFVQHLGQSAKMGTRLQ